METSRLVYTLGELQHEFVFPSSSTPAEVYSALKCIMQCVENHLPSKQSLHECLTAQPEDEDDSVQ